jgi:ankyrin repeat protein
MNGYLDLVKDLVNRGANVRNTTDAAIRLASQFGYLEVVKYLHSKGADIDKAIVSSKSEIRDELMIYKMAFNEQMLINDDIQVIQKTTIKIRKI